MAADCPNPPAPPIARENSPQPAIHSPRITGTTPGRPFLFLVPATGQGPLTFSAGNLPDGLALDPATGIISGSLQQAGTTVVELTVKNALGEASGKLTIVGGQHKLALTPPMGWNSWNCWADAVSDAKVRAAADAMVQSGLAAHGFQYVNIDDCWEGQRDAKGEIHANEKFPDMKALADYVHSKGLKLGIYSSPGPKTCAGFDGKLEARTAGRRHLCQMGRRLSQVRLVLLRRDRPRHQTGPASIKPYRVMRAALDRCNRDIVFSFCQYGMGDVWKWGARSAATAGAPPATSPTTGAACPASASARPDTKRYAGPGHWNDPDMLVVGKVGWGPSLHNTRLKPNEQFTHITLWSLLAAPLLIGCDMTQLDDFTLPC